MEYEHRRFRDTQRQQYDQRPNQRQLQTPPEDRWMCMPYCN
jgi:hypothetical protein